MACALPALPCRAWREEKTWSPLHGYNSPRPQYVYSRKMPVALKVITARMYAQAGVVLAVCTAGLVTYLGQEEKSGPSQSSVQMREYKADGTAR